MYNEISSSGETRALPSKKRVFFAMSQETWKQLAHRECIPCRGGVQALQGETLMSLQRELGRGWALIDDHHIEKAFRFPDFSWALAFVNAIGAIAGEQNHHPDIHLTWGAVTVTLWTHKIDGLTESDFILAAKVEEAYPRHAVQ